MNARSGPRRLVLPVLLTAMLAIIVAAALTPNTGVVSATSNCQYGSCSQGQEPTVPLDDVLIAIIAVETALLGVLAVLLQRRRSRDNHPEEPGAKSPPGGASSP